MILYFSDNIMIQGSKGPTQQMTFGGTKHRRRLPQNERNRTMSELASVNVSDTNFPLLVGSFAMIGLVLGIIASIVYLINAFAQYRYLRIRNYEHPWMAFIPIADCYALVEATYGRVDEINVLGFRLPAAIVKFYPLVCSFATIVLSVIPLIGTAGATLVFVAQVALGVMILQDVMLRLGKEISTGLAVFARIIAIVSPFIILSGCSGLTNGQYDYQRDDRPLASQTVGNGAGRNPEDYP